MKYRYKYKFKFIDILVILLIPITIKDFLDGYTLAGVCDSIILYCTIIQRLNEMKIR